MDRASGLARQTTETTGQSIPWPPLLVFLGIAVGTTTAIAALCLSMGWSVRSPQWAALAPLAMWAPALGRLVARRTVDRGFTSTLSLRRWGSTGAEVILCLPAAGYVVAGGTLFLWMRWHGQSWQALARCAAGRPAEYNRALQEPLRNTESERV